MVSNELSCVRKDIVAHVRSNVGITLVTEARIVAILISDIHIVITYSQGHAGTYVETLRRIVIVTTCTHVGTHL